MTKSLLPTANGPHFEWVWGLYNCVHGLVVFAAVFGAVWLLLRRPVLEMCGWLLHILIDIPTHRALFVTHFLWPISSFHFDGLPWETGWFLALNYAALATTWILLWGSRRHRGATMTGN